MKLINLLKKMDSSEYVSIVSEDSHLGNEGCVLNHWVKYGMADKDDMLLKAYKSKVLNIKVKEFNNGVYGTEIVVDYKEEN